MAGNITKTCQELCNFSNTKKIAQKKLIFFKLEVLALILKIYLKIYNSQNYCYNRSGTLVLFEYFKIPSKN